MILLAPINVDGQQLNHSAESESFEDSISKEVPEVKELPNDMNNAKDKEVKRFEERNSKQNKPAVPHKTISNATRSNETIYKYDERLRHGKNLTSIPSSAASPSPPAYYYIVGGIVIIFGAFIFVFIIYTCIKKKKKTTSKPITTQPILTKFKSDQFESVISFHQTPKELLKSVDKSRSYGVTNI